MKSQKTITTSRVLKRVLAMKSKLGFGRYSTQTVDTLFKIGETEYLWWVYYNMSNIDFNEEILTRLGVKKRIPKPGTAPELWEHHKIECKELRTRPSERIDKKWEEMTQEEQLLIIKKSAVKKKNQRIKKERDEKRLENFEKKMELTPAQLQGINHGHGKGNKKTTIPKNIK